jgi:DNA-binding NarL/FixJ family response regulator
VIVIEDEVAAYAGIAHLLRAERLRMGVAWETDSSRALLGARRYDIALLDVHLGHDSALGVAEDMPTRESGSPLALYTEEVGADVIFAEALRIGARGFVISGSSRLSLAQARTAGVDGAERPLRGAQSDSARCMRLDADEFDVLGLLATGLDRGAVARKLALTPEAVQACTRTGSMKLVATMPVQTVAALVRNRGSGRTPLLVSS